MKIVKWALIIWASCAGALVLLASISGRSMPKTEAHTFCAYGRIFVEFEEDGKRWGTLMLDYDGKPVPCREKDDVKVENTI